MIIMYSLFILLSAIFASTVQGLPQQAASIDPTDPNKSDPTTMQEQKFTFTDFEGPDPFPNEFPTLPTTCNSYNLTEECLDALVAKDQGAFWWWDSNHGNYILTSRTQTKFR